jgi:parallel beta-helix repeat protein
VEYAYGLGVEIYAGPGATGDYNQIVHNTVKYSASRGVGVDLTCSHTNVEGNYIYATGTDAFGGDLMNGQSFAIYLSGPYTRVYNNRVDRTGYSSLYVDGKTLSRDISYNYVSNTSLSLSDAGGIYTVGFSDTTEQDHIHHNILVDVIGCLSMDRNYDTGTPPTINTCSGTSSGIYVDERGNNRVIEDNTVVNSHMAGVLFHWGPGNVVQRNTLYGNKTAQIYFIGDSQPGQMLLNDIVLDNILFATDPQQRTLYLAINYDNVHFGSSDRNCFYNPYVDAHIFVSRYALHAGWVQGNMPLTDWRALSGYDGNSQEFSYLEQRDSVALAYPRQSRVVYNATLDVETIDLAGKKYCDVQGHLISGSVVLQPFESKVLIALADPPVAPTPEP